MSDASDKLIRDHFEFQARGSEDTGSPFVAALCRLLAARLDNSTTFGRTILDWPTDPKNDAMSLRVVGALHALVRSGKEPALAAAYPPAAFDADTLWAALVPAIARHDDALTAFLDSAPQTNEVARSGLILGGALHVAAAAPSSRSRSSRSAPAPASTSPSTSTATISATASPGALPTRPSPSSANGAARSRRSTPRSASSPAPAATAGPSIPPIRPTPSGSWPTSGPTSPTASSAPPPPSGTPPPNGRKVAAVDAAEWVEAGLAAAGEARRLPPARPHHRLAVPAPRDQGSHRQPRSPRPPPPRPRKPRSPISLSSPTTRTDRAA